MQQGWVQGFIQALYALEDRGDAEPLVALFAPEGTVWNIIHTEPKRGAEEIRHFWEGYRGEFQQIQSTFERQIENADQAALEWRAEGTLAQGGRPIAYRGVTLLKRGSRGITELASYYDLRPFLDALGAEPVVGTGRRLAA